MSLPLQSLTPARLQSAVPAMPLDDARRLVSTCYREAFGQRAGQVRAASRKLAEAHLTTPTLECAAERACGFDRFVKYAFRTHDGHTVETVRIPLERPGRFSVCVSSQVGCALGCRFCATGRLGLSRNLETWEIVEQVRQVAIQLRAQRPGARVHGVVFQGMGEPLSNLDRVLAAIDVLRDPCALRVSARNITVSTAGLPEGIRRLAREAPKVRLAWSLGSALPALREELMPVARAHGHEEVLAAVAEHARLTGMSPLWAVTLLSGVNDGREHGEALGRLAARFAAETGIRPRISVIPYNPIDADADPYRRSSDARQREFVLGVEAHGPRVHYRYSGGGSVQGACGQLAGSA